MHDNHKHHFDHRPVLLVVQILPLDKVFRWQISESFPALCITGPYDDRDAHRWAMRVFQDTPSNCEADKKCTPEEVDVAMLILQTYVKGLADSLTGCGGTRLSPTDLFHN